MKLLLHSTVNRGRILIYTLLSSLFVALVAQSSIYGWSRGLIPLLCFGVVAWLMDRFVYSFSIIRVKSILLICLSLSFLTTLFWLSSDFAPTSILLMPIVLLVLRLLFSSYHHYDARESGFWLTLLWLIASWISPVFIWLLPLLWLGYYMMRVRFITLFSSSIVSFLFVGAWITGYLYWSDQLPLLSDFVQRIVADANSIPFEVAQIVWMIYMGLLSILFQGSFIVRLYSDKIRTRTFLEFLMMLHIGCWILLFIFGFSHGLEYIIALLTALFAAHHLTLVDNKMSFLLFWLILLIPMVTVIALSNS